jgi:hypothetical protein
MRNCICEQTGWLKAGTPRPHTSQKDTSSQFLQQPGLQQKHRMLQKQVLLRPIICHRRKALRELHLPMGKIHNEAIQALRVVFLASDSIEGSTAQQLPITGTSEELSSQRRRFGQSLEVRGPQRVRNLGLADTIDAHLAPDSPASHCGTESRER